MICKCSHQQFYVIVKNLRSIVETRSLLFAGVEEKSNNFFEMSTNPESAQLKEIADEVDKVVAQASSDSGSAAPVDDTPTTDPSSILEVR
jgi:hypothetical protein